MKKQKVILASIGPGDPELLTLKAYKAIQAADVILYDSEQAEEMLNLVGEHTQIAKINRDRSISYNEVAEHIVNLVEEYYLAGKLVVRLKIGDAFLFGRGGTEAIKMKERGIDFEVIPGITSGIAASSVKKIKISEKNEADGVVFYMVNQKSDQQANIESIASVLKNGFTLIAYMAEGRIAKFVEALIRNGVTEDLRVVAVSNVSGKDEALNAGFLKDIHSQSDWDLIEPQTTFYMGQYVDLI